MEGGEIVMSGMLLKAPKPSAMSFKSKPCTPYMFRLRVGAGVTRLEGFEQNDEILAQPKYVIPLVGLQRCQALGEFQKYEKGAFEVATPERTWTFIANDTDTMLEWVKQIARAAFPAPTPPAPYKPTLPLPPTPSSEPVIVSPNMYASSPKASRPLPLVPGETIIYKSATETIFPVTFTANPDATALSLTGRQMLTVTPTELAVDAAPGRGRIVWPIKYLRSYGMDGETRFTFESGRRCDTGPGSFIAQSSDARKIYNFVNDFSRALAGLKSDTKSEASSADKGEGPNDTYSRLQRPSVSTPKKCTSEGVYGDPLGGVPGLYDEIPKEFSRNAAGRLIDSRMIEDLGYSDVSEVRDAARKGSGQATDALVREMRDLGYSDASELYRGEAFEARGRLDAVKDTAIYDKASPEVERRRFEADKVDYDAPHVPANLPPYATVNKGTKGRVTVHPDTGVYSEVAMDD